MDTGARTADFKRLGIEPGELREAVEAALERFTESFPSEQHVRYYIQSAPGLAKNDMRRVYVFSKNLLAFTEAGDQTLRARSLRPMNRMQVVPSPGAARGQFTLEFSLGEEQYSLVAGWPGHAEVLREIVRDILGPALIG